MDTPQRIASDLLLFMDGRRVLFDPITLEDGELVGKSVLLTRERLDKDLERLPSDSAAIPILRDMRRVCLSYLTRVPKPAEASRHWPGAINDLRRGIRDGLEALESEFGISMPGGTGRPIGRIYIPPPKRPPKRPSSSG